MWCMMMAFVPLIVTVHVHAYMYMCMYTHKLVEKSVCDNENVILFPPNQEDKILVEHFNLVCEGKRDTIWIAVILFYLVATQLVAVYLAFRTRKVKIKALNDAKYLALIIYTSTVIITVMIIGVVALGSFLNADAAVFSACILVFTTLVLGLLFVPKVSLHSMCLQHHQLL